MTIVAEELKAPPLVMRSELLRLFKVSSTRLQVLQMEADWPKELAEVAAGKIFDLKDIVDYANRRGRTLHPLEDTPPGRRHAKRKP